MFKSYILQLLINQSKIRWKSLAIILKNAQKLSSREALRWLCPLQRDTTSQKMGVSWSWQYFVSDGETQVLDI